MSKVTNKKLSPNETENLLSVLKARFQENTNRHKGISWNEVEERLKTNSDKLWSLNEMEKSGGEPDVVKFNKATNHYVFFDCSDESPKGRRSACYDFEGLESRKKFKPDNNAIDLASEMGIKLLTEEDYFELQKFGPFDTKTSSWILTPPEMRKLGGALFGDYRFGRVFFYHNGAESYYAARGFRGKLYV